MNQETRYRYEKRIRELRSEVELYRDYRRVVVDIYDAIATQVHEGKTISQGWILKKIGQLFK